MRTARRSSPSSAAATPRVRRAVAAASLLISLVACGGTATRGTTDSTRPPAATSSPRNSAGSSQLGVEALNFFLPATGAQLTSGAQFAGTMQSLRSTVTAKCMSRYGFHVPVTTSTAGAAQFFDNDQFPDLAAIARTGLLNPALLTPVHPPVALPGAEARSFRADLTRCTQLAAQPFGALLRAGSALGGLWLDAVNQIQATPQMRQSLSRFSACVQRAGTPASSGATFTAFFAWVTGLEAAAPNDDQRLAVDRHWAPIFVSCAKPTVTLQERLQSSQRALFIQQHYQQVHALQDMANSTVTAVEAQA